MTTRPSSGLPYPLFLAAALVAGVSFWPASHFVLPAVPMLAWKGAGVAMLAGWAALCAHERNGWLLAAVLAFGAAGDVLIDSAGLAAGAGAFLIGHLIAILLYVRNRDTRRRVVGAAIAVLVPLAAYAITRDLTATLYSLGLGGMAGAAWASRFPRIVACGALLFVASDLLIFWQFVPQASSFLPRLLIWPLYFGGQALIAYGVVRTLEARKRNEDLHHRL